MMPTGVMCRASENPSQHAKAQKRFGSDLKLAAAAQIRRTPGAKVAPRCTAKEIGHETRDVSEI
jgi:hypothetical protein